MYLAERDGRKRCIEIEIRRVDRERERIVSKFNIQIFGYENCLKVEAECSDNPKSSFWVFFKAICIHDVRGFGVEEWLKFFMVNQDLMHHLMKILSTIILAYQKLLIKIYW